MAEPITTWMVHLHMGFPPAEVKGTLSIDDHGLAFAREETDETVSFAFEDLLSAKRLRASPVLLVRWVREGQRGETAFYFAEPPPLGAIDRRAPGPAEVSTPSFLRRSGRRKQRRENANYLAVASGKLRDTLNAWVVEVRSGIEAARRKSS